MVDNPGSAMFCTSCGGDLRFSLTPALTHFGRYDCSHCGFIGWVAEPQDNLTKYKRQRDTDIRDEEIRGEICSRMTEMLDNPDENGIYPTSRFMASMEDYIIDLIEERTMLAKKALRIACGELSTYGNHTTEHPQQVYDDIYALAEKNK